MAPAKNHPSSNAQFGAAAAFVVAMYLAGCAGTSPQKPPAPSSTPGAQRVEPKRAVTINANCSWKDPTGYAGQMKLVAKDNSVQMFSAAVNYPKHGSCHFDMADFRQTKLLPNVELKSTGSACTVRMWRQGSQISVAFSSCRAMCTGDVVDYLWPILADANTGSCG